MTIGLILLRFAFMKKKNRKNFYRQDAETSSSYIKKEFTFALFASVTYSIFLSKLHIHSACVWIRVCWHFFAFRSLSYALSRPNRLRMCMCVLYIHSKFVYASMQIFHSIFQPRCLHKHVRASAISANSLINYCFAECFFSRSF